MKGNTTEERLQELATKWLNKTITPDEQKEFADWYNSNQGTPINIPQDFANNEEELQKRILSKVKDVIKRDNNNVKRFFSARWLSAAASIILIAGVSIYFLVNTQPVKSNRSNHKNEFSSDIKPGSSKAILTLANGNKIDLSSTKNGLLASQGKTQLKKIGDGQITYQASGKIQDPSLIYNTINVPKGGQFQIVLSDSSKVWLNSASSITFPVAFSKTERKITITGEVYLEVAKNKHLPFRVVAGKQTIEVLGTHFNIKAYADEPTIKTTLAEGSVKVTADNQVVILKPEQQSDVSNIRADKINVNTVDIDEVLAWKNGVFQFNNGKIPFIMREIARWYDVDIKYEGEIPQRSFTGSISRNVNLSEILNMLKYTGVDFKTHGNTIIVAN